MLHEVFEMIENRGQRGIETGFFELDDMLNGLQNGEMIIVAARPSMGKCLAADSEIVLQDGAVSTIEQIVKDRSARCSRSETTGSSRGPSPARSWMTGSNPFFA